MAYILTHKSLLLKQNASVHKNMNFKHIIMPCFGNESGKEGLFFLTLVLKYSYLYFTGIKKKFVSSISLIPHFSSAQNLISKENRSWKSFRSNPCSMEEIRALNTTLITHQEVFSMLNHPNFSPESSIDEIEAGDSSLFGLLIVISSCGHYK